MGEEIRGLLGKWTHYAWDSPGKGYVNLRKGFGPNKEEQKKEEMEVRKEEKAIPESKLVSGKLNMVDI